MKVWKAILIYLAAFFLQPFLTNLLIGGVTPNLILVLTVTLTFLYEDDTEFLGVGLGVLFALLNDFLFGLYVGPSALAIFGAGTLSFLLKRFANKENIISPIVNITLASFVYASLYWLIYLPLGGTYSYLYVIRSMPWQLVYNLFAAIVLYLILIKRVIKHRRDRYFK